MPSLVCNRLAGGGVSPPSALARLLKIAVRIKGDYDSDQAGVRCQLPRFCTVPWIDRCADPAPNVNGGANAPVKPRLINLSNASQIRPETRSSQPLAERAHVRCLYVMTWWPAGSVNKMG